MVRPNKTSKTKNDPLTENDPLVGGLTRLLDETFTIPGTKIRIGLDAILGLIPGIGDSLTTLLSLVIVLRAFQAGIPPAVLLRMMVNVLIDQMIGALPVVGDIFDVFWRSNRKNADLLDRFLREPGKTTRKSKLWAALFILLLLAFVSFLVYLSFKLVGLIVGLVGRVN